MNLNLELSLLDKVVFILIILLTLASVIYGNKLKKRSSSRNGEKENFLDILIMGRQLTLPMFVATLVATWYGGILGVTRIAYEDGIYNFLIQGVFWYITYFIFALFIVDKIAPYKAVTLPDLIGKMFGKKSRKLSALFNLFNVLPTVYLISLGIFLQLFFDQPLWITMSIGLLLVLSYSVWGGLRAVVFSDIVQFFSMYLAVIIVVFFSAKIFGGWSYLQETLPSSHFSFSKYNILTTFSWGFIALSTLIDPNFYQRCFAAKSPTVAKKGILISIFIWVIFDICTTLGGMYARSHLPNINSAQAYLIYIIDILPSGFKGFVLAGILATILSTLDSYLFLAGTTLSYDLSPKKFRGKPLIYYFSFIFTGILTIIIAISFDGNIRNVWKILGSYSASCMLLPVLIKYFFYKKITDTQFVFSAIMGVIATTYWILAKKYWFNGQVDELYIGMLATSLSLLFFPRIVELLSLIKKSF